MSWLNLTRNHLSPKTINRRLTSLRGFARWMGIRDPLHEYIAPQSGRPIAHPLPEGIEGVYRMLECCKNNEQEALVALCGLVGCRIGESLSTTTDWYDLDSRVVTIRGKGDKVRIVPLSERAWEHTMAAYVLGATRSDHHLVTYKDRFARQVIKNLGKRAGLRREVSSHDLRATFATEALDRSGNNIRVVQELLGHASVTTTEVYTGVRLKQMKDAVEF